MAQFARPDADLQVHQWQMCPACAGGLFAQIDEVVPNDTDFITTVPNPQNAVYEASLSDVTDPLVDTGHILRYRYRKDEPSATRQINLTVTLLQGATVIAQFTHVNIPATITQADQVLTPAQAALITDYSDLRIEFEADAVAGGTGPVRSAIVTWAELEVPDAPPTTSTITTVTVTSVPPVPCSFDPATKHRVKTLDVMCVKQLHAIGSLNVAFQNSVGSLVPIGDGWQIPGLATQLAGISPGTVVTPNKICSVFSVSVQLTQYGVPFPDDTPFVVVVPTTERCPGVGLGGGKNVVQYHDIQPLVHFVVANVNGSLQITIWVTIDACLVVSEESVLQVSARQVSCG